MATIGVAFFGAWLLSRTFYSERVGKIDMAIDTTELLHKLSKTSNIKDFINEYEQEFRNITWQEFLTDIINEKKIYPADIAKRSGQGEYVYKVIRGERKPSRDVCIAMSIGMGLSLDESQLLLRIFKWAILDPRDKRDSIIMYSIKEKRSIEQTNDLLDDMEQQAL